MSQVYHAGRAMEMRGKPVSVGDVVDVTGWPPAVLELYLGRGHLLPGSPAKETIDTVAEEAESEGG